MFSTRIRAEFILDSERRRAIARREALDAFSSRCWRVRRREIESFSWIFRREGRVGEGAIVCVGLVGCVGGVGGFGVGGMGRGGWIDGE